MLSKIYPRGHRRLLPLPMLGPQAAGFTMWLVERGYPPHPIRLRLRHLPVVEEMLSRGGFTQLDALTKEDLLACAPEDSQDDIYRSATVRSLAAYLSEKGLLQVRTPTPAEELVRDYAGFLDHVRGLAATTIANHAAAAREFLDFLKFAERTSVLTDLDAQQLEVFVCSVGARLSRGSLQHTVGYLRSFLRYLAGHGLVQAGLDTSIDTPRLYRGEKLPRSLPWEVVQRFLGTIDRSTPMGKRDFAMFLLISTYGLRSCEVAALTLDDVEWRAQRLRVPRPKTKSSLVQPLTAEVGAALVDYLRNARPALSHRQLFLRVRAPAGPIKPTAVTEAFQGWTRRGGLPIPYHGPHCLRHSLAIRLLRQGAGLKAIGDLLGHRSVESTCVYLRLHVEDLRCVALGLPQEAP